jgi:hypothetical protein
VRWQLVPVRRGHCRAWLRKPRRAAGRQAPGHLGRWRRHREGRPSPVRFRAHPRREGVRWGHPPRGCSRAHGRLRRHAADRSGHRPPDRSGRPGRRVRMPVRGRGQPDRCRARSPGHHLEHAPNRSRGLLAVRFQARCPVRFQVRCPGCSPARPDRGRTRRRRPVRHPLPAGDLACLAPARPDRWTFPARARPFRLRSPDSGPDRPAHDPGPDPCHDDPTVHPDHQTRSLDSDLDQPVHARGLDSAPGQPGGGVRARSAPVRPFRPGKPGSTRDHRRPRGIPGSGRDRPCPPGSPGSGSGHPCRQGNAGSAPGCPCRPGSPDSGWGHPSPGGSPDSASDRPYRQGSSGSDRGCPSRAESPGSDCARPAHRRNRRRVNRPRCVAHRRGHAGPDPAGRAPSRRPERGSRRSGPRRAHAGPR